MDNNKIVTKNNLTVSKFSEYTIKEGTGYNYDYEREVIILDRGDTELHIYFSKPSEFKHLPVYLSRFFLLVVARYTQTNFVSRAVLLDLKELANIQQYNGDIADYKKQVLKMLKILYRCEVVLLRKGKSVGMTRILPHFEFINGKQVLIELTEPFFEVLKNEARIIPYTADTFKSFRSRDGDNIYLVNVKLQEYWNMNRGKPNQGIISVEALLRSTNIPNEQEITDREYARKRQKPLENILNKIEGVSWSYLYQNKKAKNLKYREFTKAYIEFVLK